MKKWFYTCNMYWWVSAVLGALLVSNWLSHPRLIIISHTLLAIIGTVIPSLLINYFQKRKWYFPNSALVSGLIISLILDLQAKWLVVLIVAVMAMLGKYIFGFNHKHIFNPVCLSLWFSTVIFGNVTSWWGVAGSSFPILVIIIVGMGLLLFRLKRIWLVLGFLIVYLSYLSLLTHSLPLGRVWEGTVIFFSMVMLVEPMTSPGEGVWGKWFGVMVGLLMIAVQSISKLDGDPLITTLLLGNLVSYLWINKPLNLDVTPS